MPKKNKNDSDEEYFSDSSSNSDNSKTKQSKPLSKIEFKKFLAKQFPSKYSKKKLDEEEEKEEEDMAQDKDKDNKKRCSSSSCGNKKKRCKSSDESDVSSVEKDKKKKGNFNIILQIGGGKGKKSNDDDDDYENDSYWEDISEEDEDINGIETEDEDEPVSSDSDSEDDDDDDDSSNNSSDVDDDSNEDSSNDESSEDVKKQHMDIATIEENIKEQKDLLFKFKNDFHQSSTMQKYIRSCEKQIKAFETKKAKKEKKHKEKNSRIFRKIIRDKNAMNDVDFFNKMEMDDQKKILKELREINKVSRIEKPYRLSLLETSIPVHFKAAAMKKINLLRGMDPSCGEYFKIKNWVDTFMRMPFGQYKTLHVNIEDGVERCHEFMEHAKKTLDSAVYGLNDAKMQIMQMLGQLVTNPKSIGSAIAIHGPPGTGKTSLVKEGISKILNRPFAFIALGGATDSSFLEGHSYTYEGSTWGKIVQILIDCQCMNPVIYFDELDKISDTPKGEEIAGILTHLTDTTQNSQFHDKYFSEIDFDLSKCLFIFSYNDESKINPILKDRMYRIQTMGYNMKQKTVISNQYLLPKIREQVRFSLEEVVIPDDTIHYLVDNFCNKEDGVRNLKRCLEIIHTKLNLYRLMKPGSNLFEEDMSLKVDFPFIVTKAIVDKLIKKAKDNTSVLYSLYV